MKNAITEASGTWKIIKNRPLEVLMVIPLCENPALVNLSLVDACLLEIQMHYPKITSMFYSLKVVSGYGPTLVITVK